MSIIGYVPFLVLVIGIVLLFFVHNSKTPHPTLGEAAKAMLWVGMFFSVGVCCHKVLLHIFPG